jgi:flavorubredoxin
MVTVQLADDIYWVGVVDWNMRDFHGYATRRGTTYNAYLIVDEKVALVDTVKAPFYEECLEKINEIVNPEKIDYVIINHVEMDHSSGLPPLAKHVKNATIKATQRGKEGLLKHFGETLPIQTVKTGDELKLGKRTLRFIEAPMLHWPDTMFTYIVEDEILMPNDAFGQHLATSQRFDDEVDDCVLWEEVATYYANILMPFGSIIIRKLQELTEMHVSPKMIAPSHGVIWRSDPAKIVKAYSEWSEGTSKQKAVVAYGTMWGSTDKMAKAIAEGIASQGVKVKFYNFAASSLAEVVAEILEAKAVIVGSSTLNNQMLPSVSAFLTYINGLKPRGKLWTFFGSYGWGGGAARQMVEAAKKAGFDVYEPPLEVKYVPTKEELEKCFNFGKEIAAKIKG